LGRYFTIDHCDCHGLPLRRLIVGARKSSPA
jgi:hypothetical protein